MKPRQVPIFLYWRVENVQFWINSISHPGWLSCILNFTLLYFESIFLKIVHQKGLFDAIKENPNFPNCRRILNIYWQWLLIMHQYLQVYQHASFLDYLIHKFGHSCPLISFSYLEINHCHLHFVPSQEQKTTSLNYHTCHFLKISLPIQWMQIWQSNWSVPKTRCMPLPPWKRG